MDGSHDNAQSLLVRWLGRQDYEPVWRAMQRFTEQRDAGTRRFLLSA
jgi:lipoate-protein ligase B